MPGEQALVETTALQIASIKCTTVAEAINATRESAYEAVKADSRLRIVSLANYAIFRERLQEQYTGDYRDNAERQSAAQTFDKAAMLFCTATSTGASAEAVLALKHGRLPNTDVAALKNILEVSASIVQKLGAATGLKLSLTAPRRIEGGEAAAAGAMATRSIKAPLDTAAVHRLSIAMNKRSGALSYSAFEEARADDTLHHHKVSGRGANGVPTMAKPFKSWAHSVRDMYFGNSGMPALEAARLVHGEAHDGYAAYDSTRPAIAAGAGASGSAQVSCFIFLFYLCFVLHLCSQTPLLPLPLPLAAVAGGRLWR